MSHKQPNYIDAKPIIAFMVEALKNIISESSINKIIDDSKPQTNGNIIDITDYSTTGKYKIL